MAVKPTVELQTLVNCTEKIIGGLSSEPKTVGDSLHGKGLISTEVLREITEVPATKTDNARKLYLSISESVRHYPSKYFDFISILRGNTLLYSDLLKVLEQTYKEKKDAENQCNVPTPKTSHGDSSLVPSSAEQVKCFEDRFYELRTSALTDVMDKNIPVACFRQTLMNLPNAISKENEEFVIEKYSTFKEAESVEDIFLHLNFYLSFLDFSLLEHIIEHFGSRSLQCKMKQYSMDMGLFRAETSVADIIPHLSGRPEPPPHFARLKVKLNFDPQTCTLEYLEQHRRNFGSVCSLSKFTLFLVELQEGSLVEIWLIPLNCVPILKDLIQEKNVTRVFLHLDILELSVNNECLYPFSSPKDAVDTPPVISHSEIISQTSFPEQSTSSSVLPPVLVPTHDIPSILPPLPDDTTLPENVILPSGDPPHVFPGMQKMASPMPSSICQVVDVVPDGNGLAIIISNDYKGTRMAELTETHKDGEKMAIVFQELKYDIAHFKNVKAEKLYQLLREATQSIKYPDRYRCIVLVFSGHGSCDPACRLTYLFTQDCQKVLIKDIVTPFEPKSSPSTATLPKVFLLDACLGDNDMYMEAVTVAKGVGEIRELCEKGATPVITMDLPPEGNYILAHSTSIGYRSFEIKSSGGVWINALAEQIRKQRCNESVTNILTSVNCELLKLYQHPSYKKAMTQPHFVCKLHDTLYFVPPVESQAGLSRQLSSDPKVTFGQTVVPKDAKGVYRSVLNQSWQKGQITSPEFKERTTKSGEFLADVSFVVLATRRNFKISSSSPKPTKRDACEEAARVAVRNNVELFGTMEPKSVEGNRQVPKSAVRPQTFTSVQRQTSSERTEVQKLKEGCESKNYKYKLEERKTGKHERFQFIVIISDSSSRMLVQELGEEESSKKAAQHSAARRANNKLGFH